MDRFCYLRFMLVCVVLSCLFLAALWSPAGKGLTSWLFYVLCFPVFCRFPKYVLVHIKIRVKCNIRWYFIRVCTIC